MTNTLTPKALAEEIGCDAKSLRGYLRKEYPRQAEAKGTSWIVPADAADAAREHFAKQRAEKATAPATPIRDAIRREIAAQA